MRGTIRKRTGKRGVSWQVIVRTPPDPITGCSRQVSGTASTRRAAEDLLNRLLGEVGTGQHTGLEVTVSELLERWYEIAAPDWSPKTAVETRRFIDNYVEPHLGRVKLSKLTTVALDTFYADLRARGGRDGRPLSVSSVRRVHVVVRRSLAQAKRWGWIASNPAAEASPGKLPRVEIHPPDVETVLRLIDLADAEEPEFAVFPRLAASTGARRGELCALLWSDIDLEKNTVVIARSLVDDAHGYFEKDTKNHSARRISLDRSMARFLKTHRKRQIETGLAVGVTLAKDSRVFSYEPDGSVPWRPDGVTHRFVRLRDRAGVRNVRLHDLRHFVATRMLGAGVPVPTVSGRLGHANTATTLNVYSHFLEASDQEAAQTLGGILDAAARGSSEAEARGSG